MNRWIPTLAGLPALALLAGAGLAPTPRARLIYPAGGIARPAPLRVMAVAGPTDPAPKVLVDGKPLPLRKMRFDRAWLTPGRLKATGAAIGDRQKAALWVGTARLPKGAHRVALGAASVAAAIGGGTGSAHIPVVPGADLDCSGCHAMKGGALGAVDTPAVCSRCHTETNVQMIHKHVASALAKCGMCHDPHGATRARLLIDDRAKLCTQCHAAGHSKE